MRYLPLIALALASCSTTPAAVSDKPVSFSIEIAKPPQVLASCIADHMTGGQIQNEGDHYAVIRSNDFGTIGRWDIYPTANGSRAEWRKVGGLTTGQGAITACE